MVKPRKIRKTKVLVHPDGTQELVAVGLVDKDGCQLYMLDTESVKRFEFAESNTIIAQLAEERDSLETALRRSDYYAKALAAELRKAYRTCDRLFDLCDEMFDIGRFGSTQKQAGLKLKLTRCKNAIPTREERERLLPDESE